MLSIALLLSATNLYAASSFSTNKVRVIDGDTVEVIPPNQKSERVRLLGIDAPENDQSYGSASKAALQRCVANKKVTIQWAERDQYGRIIGKVKAGSG